MNSLTNLLEKAKQQLSNPFANKQRQLLIYLNGTYLLLCPIFLISEKINTGNYVPHVVLGYVYTYVGIANLFSILYNSLLLTQKNEIKIGGQTIRISGGNVPDTLIRWLSILSIMVMSALNMLSFGNPSNDSILTDFAFGHSLIVLTAILLGRTMSFIWFIVVICILIYNSFRIGFAYQYNYLTPAESSQYEHALSQKKQWDVNRQKLLQQEGLNPPTVSRYFNEWLIFILIAFFTAYFFTGITFDMIRIIPDITQNIAHAIEGINQQELEREREKNLQEEQKMRLQQESLWAELSFLKSQINPHFLYNTLNYLYVKSLNHSDELADSVLKLSDIMRYSLRQDSDYVLLDEEIAYMKDFIALHQLRNENGLNIDFVVEGSTGQKVIAPFLLISLLENAFKHGRMDDKRIPLLVKISSTDNCIDFYIHNQKNTMPIIKSTKIGIVNIRRRLNLLYPSLHLFKIEQDSHTFSCWLTIRA